MSTLTTTTRNATIEDLASLLQDQHGRKIDMIVPAEQVRSYGANLVIETIGKRLRFGQDRIDGILDHFVRGGQMTAGGVLNAVTSYAQTVEDADDAMEIEAQAIAALDLAAAGSRS